MLYIFLLNMEIPFPKIECYDDTDINKPVGWIPCWNRQKHPPNSCLYGITLYVCSSWDYFELEDRYAISVRKMYIFKTIPKHDNAKRNKHALKKYVVSSKPLVFHSCHLRVFTIKETHAAGINDTGDKFCHQFPLCCWNRWQFCHRCQQYKQQVCRRCQRRRWQIATGINDSGGKFATGVIDTGGK